MGVRVNFTTFHTHGLPANTEALSQLVSAAINRGWIKLPVKPVVDAMTELQRKRARDAMRRWRARNPERARATTRLAAARYRTRLNEVCNGDGI